MSKTKREWVIAEVMGERQAQDYKWGVQDHHPHKWLSILGEEVGEACKALLEFEDGICVSSCDYRQELIQAAAVAIAAVECYDRKE